MTLNSKTITYEQLAKVIDHSLLRPELTDADVFAGCELAARYHVATVCVKPCDVKLAKEALKDSDVLVSTVVGFPHGSNLTSIKVAEAQQVMEDGALELDMVLNVGQLRSGKHDVVREDIKAVCDVAHAGGVKVRESQSDFRECLSHRRRENYSLQTQRSRGSRLGQDFYRICVRGRDT